MFGPHSKAGDQIWRPATFRQRGVAVPFTAPSLAGARVRAGMQGPELVVPHPAGARGVYILAWPKIAPAYALTVHDTLLLDHVGRLRALNPRSVRLAARAVAAGGSAGLAARQAANAAAGMERARQARASALLVARALEQLAAPPDPDPTHGLARALGVAAQSLAPAVERLSFAYGWLGLDRNDLDSPSRQILACLDRMATGLAAVATHTPSLAIAPVIQAMVETTLLLGRRCLDRALDQADDLPGLLRTLLAGPPADASLMHDLARCAWVLDGWEQICLVWHLAADTGNKREALAEMALMIPPFPNEADSWSGSTVDPGERRQLVRSSQGFDAWRTGSAQFDLIARNEHMRMLAA